MLYGKASCLLLQLLNISSIWPLLSSYVNNDEDLSISFPLQDLHGAVGDSLNFCALLVLCPIKDCASPAITFSLWPSYSWLCSHF